jgi:hypothetical protein
VIVKRAARVSALVSLMAACGCYVYHPIQPAAAPLNTRVRATVSAEKAAELAPVLRDVTPEVTGTLVSREGDALMLEVPLYGTGTDGVDPLHSRVEIRPGDLVSLESRTLSKWRTAAVVGVLAAAVVGSWSTITGQAQVTDKPGVGIDNAILSLPIFSLAAGSR